MRVLLVGRFYEGSFATGIRRGFNRLGHDCIAYETGPKVKLHSSRVGAKLRQATRLMSDAYGQTASARAARTAHLRKAVDQLRPDLILSSHDFLYPEQVAEIKRVSAAPVALWFPDAVSNFRKALFLSAQYDVMFFKDPYLVKTLSDCLAQQIYYLPECFVGDPNGVTAVSESDTVKYGCEIATAGNLYSYRQAFFQQLSGYDVKIWGNRAPSWMNTDGIDDMIQNEYLTGDHKVRAYRCAKIVINSLHPAEIWGVNARTFDVCGIGGFQLVSWRPALGDLFEDGKELVTFRSFSELKEKIDFFLPRDESRSEIAAEGRARVLRDHTYERRLPVLLETVFGTVKGFPMPAVAHDHAPQFA